MTFRYSDTENGDQENSSAIAIIAPARLEFVKGSKSMSAERSEHARRIVREVVDAKFDGVVSRAARDGFHVSQSMLSEFLAGSRGLGPKLLEAIATFTNTPMDQVVGRSSSDDSLVDASDPYPNRARALAAAALLGKDPVAIAKVRARPGFASDVDAPPSRWFDDVEKEEARLKGVLPPRRGENVEPPPPPPAGRKGKKKK